MEIDMTNGHTYTEGSAQTAGGDCTPATSSAEQPTGHRRREGGGEGRRDPRPHRLGRSAQRSASRSLLRQATRRSSAGRSTERRWGRKRGAGECAR
jgi:hypothetical protein